MRSALSGFPPLARLVLTLLMLFAFSSCAYIHDRVDATSGIADATDVVILKSEECKYCYIEEIEEIRDGEFKPVVEDTIQLGEVKIDPGMYNIFFIVCVSMDWSSETILIPMTLDALPGHIYEVEQIGRLPGNCAKKLRLIDRTAGMEVWSWKHPKVGGSATYAQTREQRAKNRKRQAKQQLDAFHTHLLLKLAAEREKQEKEQLALSGDPESQYQMGIRFETDKAARPKWLRLAAEQGHVEAMYALGTNMDTSIAERRRWLRLAAQQGYADAMYALAKDSDAGSTNQWRWYCQAAVGSHAEAQMAIGHAFETGSGEIKRDLILAYLWLNAAEPPGHAEKRYGSQKYVKTEGGWICCDYRTSIDALKKKMTPTQIAEAERLAIEWEPNAEDCFEPNKAQATN